MNREKMIGAFCENHETLIDLVTGLTDAQFMHCAGDKWNAGQQLLHCTLCLQPINIALTSADYIREKFGVLNRPGMNYDTLIATYKTGLANGGKSPERFLPAEVSIDDRQKLVEDLKLLVYTIREQLQAYDDAALDALVLPHPFLGSLSIRELFFLMSYHPLHHLEQVKGILKGR